MTQRLIDILPASYASKAGLPWTEASAPLPGKMPDGSDWPRISIVTPSYNQGKFIEETIRTVLLQGYPNLECKDRDISFHILGKDLTGTSEMTPNIHYHGAVKYDELPNWLSGCDIGLITYKQGPANYGSPIKLFDYLSSGLLVVLTDQPQVKEILNEIGISEFIVKNGDYRSMAKILLMLRDDKEKIVSGGKLGRDLIKAKYTWRHNAVKIQNKLQEIMKC